jgi:large subunit ribosomal protein LP0
LQFILKTPALEHVKMSKAERKAQYFEKLLGFLEEFPKVLVVSCDNVGSNQMQQVRHSRRNAISGPR